MNLAVIVLSISPAGNDDLASLFPVDDGSVVVGNYYAFRIIDEDCVVLAVVCAENFELPFLKQVSRLRMDNKLWIPFSARCRNVNA
ncbi:hypothetical protein V9T40_014672 [Parthenolecanium corni]|uniref:Uncharacterized protein n=1 Tax=Parthenolecanium corni TaxID=536013 RepID=A0AAN9XY16_9HEMI